MKKVGFREMAMKDRIELASFFASQWLSKTGSSHPMPKA
jgi:hypothetical protein